MVTGVIAVGALAVVSDAPLVVTWGARLAVAGTVGVAALSAIGWYWRGAGSPPKLASTAAYFVSGTVAALVAWKRALLERGTPVWEPTPRALTTAGS
jgi:hypothetical protein